MIDAVTPSYCLSSYAILSAISAAYFSLLCLHLNTPVSVNLSTGSVCGADIKIGPPKMKTYGTSGFNVLNIDTYSCTFLFSTSFLWCLLTFSIEHILVGALDIFSFLILMLADSRALLCLFPFPLLLILLTLLFELDSLYATELLILFLLLEFVETLLLLFCLIWCLILTVESLKSSLVLNTLDVFMDSMSLSNCLLSLSMS
jgi:hypothetical protein